MTGMKITLSAAMRARDVSRPYSDEAELPQDTDAGPARGGELASGENRSQRQGDPRGAASASEPTGSAPYGENRPLRGEAPARRSERSERAQARFGQARGVPEAKREGPRAAQAEDTAGTGAGSGGSKGGEAPLGNTAPPGSRRTRHRKRRAR